MKQKIFAHWFEIFIGFCFFLSIFFFIWPIRFYPYSGEVAQLLVNGAKVLSQRNFEPLTLSEFGINHPPLSMIYLNFVWRILGESVISSHMGMIPFGFLLLVSTYFLAKKFTSQSMAIVLTFLLSFLPVIVASIQLVEISYMLCSLITTSLALWFYDNKYLSVIVLAVAVLINLAAILLLPVLIVDWFLNGKKDRWQLFLLPFGSLVIWLFYHGSIASWWIISPDNSFDFFGQPQIYIRYIGFVLTSFIVKQFNWLLIVPVIILLSFFVIQKKLEKSERRLAIIFFLLWILSSIYFGLQGNYILTKSLFLYPPLIILFTILLEKTVEYLFQEKKEWLSITILLGLCLVSLSQWRVNHDSGPGFKFIPDTNLVYQDQILIFREALAFIETTQKDSIIYGGFPEANFLDQPYLGYVTTPIAFDSCDNLIPNENLTQVILTHPYHPSQIDCQEILKTTNVLPIKQFSKNGKWIELFEVVKGATGSATLPEDQL